MKTALLHKQSKPLGFTAKDFLSSLVLLVFVVILVMPLLLADHVPRTSLTRGRMQMMKRRILQYAHTHDRLPADLSSLPEIPGYDNSIKDGWRRPIIYEVDAQKNVTLKSLGRDGLDSGKGQNAELIGIFPAKDALGKWNDEMVPWTKEPKAARVKN